VPRYVLDTNICIYLMRNSPPAVAARFARCVQGDVLISSITYAELQYGIETAANPQQERSKLAALVEDVPVAAFDQAAAEAYGPVRRATRDRRRDALDKLIAAHAIALGAILVTNNPRDFAHYPGLLVENWLDPDTIRNGHH